MSNDGSDASKIRIYKFPADFFSCMKLKASPLRCWRQSRFSLAPPAFKVSLIVVFISRFAVHRSWENVTMRFTLLYKVCSKLCQTFLKLQNPRQKISKHSPLLIAFGDCIINKLMSLKFTTIKDVYGAKRD